MACPRSSPYPETGGAWGIHADSFGAQQPRIQAKQALAARSGTASVAPRELQIHATSELPYIWLSLTAVIRITCKSDRTHLFSAVAERVGFRGSAKL